MFASNYSSSHADLAALDGGSFLALGYISILLFLQVNFRQFKLFMKFFFGDDNGDSLSGIMIKFGLSGLNCLALSICIYNCDFSSDFYAF